MLVSQFTIKNPSGIHAIYAAQISHLASACESDVFLRKDKRTANCASVMSVLGLCVRCGDTITLMVDGSDEVKAHKALIGFLEGLSE